MRVRPFLFLAVLLLSFSAWGNPCADIIESLGWFFSGKSSPRLPRAMTKDFFSNERVRFELRQNAGLDDARIDEWEKAMTKEVGAVADEARVAASPLPTAVKELFPRFLDGDFGRAHFRARREPFPFSRAERDLFFGVFIPHARRTVIAGWVRSVLSPERIEATFHTTDPTPDFERHERSRYLGYGGPGERFVVELREWGETAGFELKLRGYRSLNESPFCGFDYVEPSEREYEMTDRTPEEWLESRVTLTYGPFAPLFALVAKVAENNAAGWLMLAGQYRAKEAEYVRQFLLRGNYVDAYRRIDAKLGNRTLSDEGGLDLFRDRGNLVVRERGYGKTEHRISLEDLAAGRLKIDFLRDGRAGGSLRLDERDRITTNVDALRVGEFAGVTDTAQIVLLP